jgi:hypothetical protein
LALLGNIWFHSLKLAIQLGQKDWDLRWRNPEKYGNEYYGFHEDDEDDSGDDTDDEDEKGKHNIEKLGNNSLWMDPGIDAEEANVVLEAMKGRAGLKNEWDKMPEYNRGNIPIAHGANGCHSANSTYFQTPRSNMESISRALAEFCSMVPKNRRQLASLYKGIMEIPKKPERFENMVFEVMWSDSKFFKAAPELYEAAPAFMMSVVEFVRTRYWSKLNTVVDAVRRPPRRPTARQTMMASSEIEQMLMHVNGISNFS